MNRYRPGSEHAATKGVRLMAAFLLPCCLLLGGCLATGEELNDQRLPPSKNAKLMEEGKMGSKVVNKKAPSQLRYSLYLLTKPSLEADYPAISDLSETDTTLRTEKRAGGTRRRVAPFGRAEQTIALFGHAPAKMACVKSIDNTGKAKSIKPFSVSFRWHASMYPHQPNIGA